MPPNTRLKAANEMPSQSQVTPTTSPSKRQADGPAVSDTSTKIRRIANIFSMDTSHPGRKLTAQFTKVYEDFGEVQDEQERIVRLLEQGSSRQDEMDVKTEQHEKQLKAHSSQFDKLDKIIKDELGTWPTSVAFKIEIEQWKIKQKEFCDKQKQSNGDWQNEQTQMRATEKKQLEEALKLQNDAIQQVRQEFGDAENEQQRRIEAVEKQLGNNQQLNEEDAIALEVRQHDLELNFRKDRAKVATLAQIVMQNGDDTEQLFNDTEAHYVTTMAAMEEFKRDSSAIQAFQATQIEALLSRVDSMEAARAGYDQEVARLSEAHKKELDQQIQANTELLNRVEAVEAEAKDSKIFRGISKPQIESAQQHIAALQTAHGNYATAEHLAIAKDEISKIVTDVLNSHATKEELDDLQTSLVTALQTHLHKLNQTCHDRTQGARNLIQNQKFVTTLVPQVPQAQTRLATDGNFNFTLSRSAPGNTRLSPSPPATGPYPSPSTPTSAPQPFPPANPQGPPQYFDAREARQRPGPPQHVSGRYPLAQRYNMPRQGQAQARPQRTSWMSNGPGQTFRAGR